MNTRKLDEALGEIDARYVEQAMDYRPRGKKRGWARRAAAAACLALVIIAAFAAVSRQGGWIELSDASIGVTVRYTSKTPGGGTGNLLAPLTEEELFTTFNTAVFKGTVLRIRNIERDFNGWKDYRAIAEIQVEKVYRGPCGAGDTVSVLLPCPIERGVWVEDTGVASQMKAGTRGIFMPIIYDESSICEANGARLLLTDIAGYGFADGMRFAFLDTGAGLAFARFAYKSIDGAATLEEVEDYIEAMLGRIRSGRSTP